MATAAKREAPRAPKPNGRVVVIPLGLVADVRDALFHAARELEERADAVRRSPHSAAAAMRNRAHMLRGLMNELT